MSTTTSTDLFFAIRGIAVAAIESRQYGGYNQLDLMHRLAAVPADDASIAEVVQQLRAHRENTRLQAAHYRTAIAALVNLDASAKNRQLEQALADRFGDSAANSLMDGLVALLNEATHYDQCAIVANELVGMRAAEEAYRA